MKTGYIIAFSLLLPAFSGQAQKRIKEYYDNGNLKFEGQYTYTWKQDDFADVIVQELPEQNYSAKRQMDLTNLNKNLNLIPTKAYEGLCRFYYPGGQQFCAGNYAHGVPNGKFTYWYKNGTKGTEMNFVNGMIDGLRQVWEEDGSLRCSFSFKAISQDSLAALYKSYFLDNTGEYHADTEDKGRVFDNLMNRYLLFEIGAIKNEYREELTPFRELLNTWPFRTSIWDGKFILNRGGKPYLEFYYHNNQPSGTWKRLEENQLYFECTFKDGKAISAKNYRAEKEVPRPVEVKVVEGTTAPGVDAIMPSEPDVPEGERIFTYVEQMPEFPGGQAALGAFLSKNLVYPEKARENKIEGKSMVQFIVKEDGHIDADKIKVVRSLGNDTDEEATRLVKIMPVWKPGKQNGRAVKVMYTIAVPFKLQ